MKIRLSYIITAWCMFAVVITILMYIVHPPGSRDFNFLSELIWESAFALVWMPATPLALWISRRYPLTGPDRWRWRNIAIIGMIGIILSVLLCFAHSVVAYSLNGASREFTVDLMLYSFYYNIDKMLIIYCILVVLQQALSYYEEIQQKELRSSQLQTQLSQAQMQALKMQLQPHFLFNTLNAIVTLIHKNPDAAEEMIVRLSDFLRMTLEVSGRDIVSLKEELEFIRAYLDIEQVRFEGRLRYECSVPYDLLDAHVPLLLLQPLVENAVKHGISKYSHSHSVAIAGSASDGVLLLSISDDGIPSGQLFEAMSREGIGIRNTRMRLNTIYGNAAHMTMTNNGTHGLRVELRIPLVRTL